MPNGECQAPAYDAVAELYDRAFADIRVRRVEWRWLMRRLRELQAPPRVLDVGCGTGALLRALSPHILSGTGVDVSHGMITQAQSREPRSANLRFQTAADGVLPFASASFDVVISFLSFRYLDWPRIMREAERVLAPGGRIWVIDLCAERARIGDTLRIARSAARRAVLPFRSPGFARDLRALTSHPDWHAMLARHPIRALEDYRRFFESALPGRRLQALDVAPSRRVVALDSGPLFR